MVVGHHVPRSDSIEMEESMEEQEMGVVNVDHHSQNSIEMKETVETNSLSGWNPTKQ